MVNRLFKAMLRVNELYMKSEISFFDYEFQMNNIITCLKYEVINERTLQEVQ